MALPPGLGLASRLRGSAEGASLPPVFERHRTAAHSDQLRVALERGRDGHIGAWCLELPGCCVLVRPGEDPAGRAAMAILEFAAWAHQRAAEKLTLDPGQVSIAESVASSANLGKGESHAFFPHDGEPPRPDEFPLWATPHDRAFDELREVARSIPARLQDSPLTGSGQTIRESLRRAAETERFLASRLSSQAQPPREVDRDDDIFRALQAAHVRLQEVVCDVAPATRCSLADGATGELETWSVRKVMRRSIWHLRYRTWEIRRAVGAIWLG